MSKYLGAHKLNRRAHFERKAGERDAWGQPIDVWEPAFSCWAHVKTITGSGFVNQEFTAADREISRSTASIRIRARRVPPSADMRVRVAGKVYEIRVVLPDEQDSRYIDIGVAEGANNG